MTLTILSEAEIKGFVDGLDLGPGTEASRTLSALLLLPPASFVRAISAIHGGLITFQNIRSLPAINHRLVNALINSRLGQDDPAALTWRYREEWVPSSIDVPALRVDSIGPASDSLAAKFDSRWDRSVRPRYDFTRTDETAFHAYSEAYVAYMVSANSEQGKNAVASFRDRHDEFLRRHPVFERKNQIILQLVERSLTEPLFLVRRGGGIAPDPLLDYVLSASFRRVPVIAYRRFMETAYSVMAGENDPERTGAPGAARLAAAHSWTAAVLDGTGDSLSDVRMARVHLPRAYGSMVLPAETIAEEAAVAEAVVDYLDAARSAILEVRDCVAVQMERSGAQYRVTPGSALGLLLVFTFS